MSEATPVEGNENLYRRVRAIANSQRCYVMQGDRLVFTAAAFLDPHKQPSVDRAKLRNSPHESRLTLEEGIVTLTADAVRAIGMIQSRDEKGNIKAEHTVDVVPDPIPQDNPRGLPENPAHALIVTTPQLTSNSAFERLKEALARVATDAGWTVMPNAERPTP